MSDELPKKLLQLALLELERQSLLRQIDIVDGSIFALCTSISFSDLDSPSEPNVCEWTPSHGNTFSPERHNGLEIERHHLPENCPSCGKQIKVIGD